MQAVKAAKGGQVRVEGRDHPQRDRRAPLEADLRRISTRSSGDRRPTDRRQEPNIRKVAISSRWARGLRRYCGIRFRLISPFGI
jgi:hypothetical protein